MPTQQMPGVPDGLPPDELEQWSNDLVAFLTSDRVPANFRPWARAQADQLDAYMASGGDLESAPASAEEPAVAVAAPKAPKTPQARPARPAASGEQRTMVLELPEKTGKLILGVLVGLFVLGAIYGIVALTNRGKASSSTLPSTANATALPFDDARAGQLMGIVQSDPSNKDALLELGDMNLNAERYTDAITWYTKLSAVDPTNKDVMNNISTANLYLGNTDAAKTWINKVLAIDPNNVAAHYNLGYVYASGNPVDLQAAVKEWETVVALAPTSQEGQTAKTHADGLKAQFTRTAAARAGGGTPVPAGTSSPGTPVPAATAP
jgi:tetratricopeptide (TPR) repeat protein